MVEWRAPGALVRREVFAPPRSLRLARRRHKLPAAAVSAWAREPTEDKAADKYWRSRKKRSPTGPPGESICFREEVGLPSPWCCWRRRRTSCDGWRPTGVASAPPGGNQSVLMSRGGRRLFKVGPGPGGRAAPARAGALRPGCLAGMFKPCMPGGMAFGRSHGAVATAC